MDPNRDFKRGSGNRHGKFRPSRRKGARLDRPDAVQNLHGIGRFLQAVSPPSEEMLEFVASLQSHIKPTELTEAEEDALVSYRWK